MKKYCLILFALFVGLAASAQTIVCEKVGTTAASLGEGMAAVKFVSSQSDWVIKPIKGDEALPLTKNIDKKYVYEFRTNVTNDHERTYLLGRKGSAITDQCVAKGLRSGYCVTYNLEEVADTLQRIELQTGETSRYMVKGGENMACVEITTSVKDLKVSSAWRVNESTSNNGARVISVIVDVAQLTTLKSEVEALTEKVNTMEKNGDYLNMEPVNNELNKKQAQLEPLSDLMIGGDGIKGVTVSLLDLAKKELRRYAVIAITENFDGLLAYARQLRDGRASHTESSYYDAARIAYDKAINHKDAPQNLLETIRSERNEMAWLRKYTYFVERTLERAQTAERNKGADDPDICKNLLGRSKFLNDIIAKHPEIKGFEEIRSENNKLIAEHGCNVIIEDTTETKHYPVIQGKAVKGSSFLLPSVSGLRIFAAKHAGKNKDSELTELTKVHRDGSFRIVLGEGFENTAYILFEGERNARRVTGTVTDNVTDMGTLTLEH